MQNTAVSYDADLSRVENSGRHKVKNVFGRGFVGIGCIRDIDRVSGVGASIGSDNVIVILGHDVHELSFAFIAPLAAEDSGYLAVFVGEDGHGRWKIGIAERFERIDFVARHLSRASG